MHIKATKIANDEQRHGSKKHIGFCDVRGFSSAVLKGFDATFAVYQQIRNDVRS
jgi:hypothetical protein